MPTISDMGSRIIRMVSYFAATLSLRYWVAIKVSFAVTASPSFIHITTVGGDPEEEQFIAKTLVELSCRDEILTGTG